MRNLVKGLHRFQTHVFDSRRELFARLSTAQHPDALFITCSDSRIVPSMLTQTGPGELFILRNAGNIVPPHGAAPSGEAATVEYAVAALGVRDVIVCGHTLCGAMTAILEPGSLDGLPAMRAWLTHAEATQRIVEENYKDRDAAYKLNAAVQENVLVQLEHLRTLPTVAARLAAGTLKLHGWVYKIETGEVFGYDPEHEHFVNMMPDEPPQPPPVRRDVKGTI